MSIDAHPPSPPNPSDPLSRSVGSSMREVGQLEHAMPPTSSSSPPAPFSPEPSKWSSFWRSMSATFGPPPGLSFEQLSAGLVHRSFSAFPRRWPLRKACILLIRSKGFDWFILLVIFANLLQMCIQSNRPGFEETELGIGLIRSDYFFSAVFTLEMMIKMMALGLCAGKRTYFRDGWNWLDAIVVAISYINYIPGVANLTALRALRVLRALRTVSRVKGMRMIVITLLRSMPQLLDVAGLFAFVMFIYGLVGVTVFGGALRQHCATVDGTDQSAVLSYSPGERIPNSLIKYSVEDPDSFCSGPLVESSSKFSWVRSAHPTPYGWMSTLHSEPGQSDRCDRHAGEVCWAGGGIKSNPGDGYINYDNILYAWLNVFIVFTMDGWSAPMYALQDAVSPYIWPFFVSLILIGPFFVIQLSLAVLYTQFGTSDEPSVHSTIISRAEPEENSPDKLGGGEQVDGDDGKRRDEDGPPPLPPLPPPPPPPEDLAAKSMRYDPTSFSASFPARGASNGPSPTATQVAVVVPERPPPLDGSRLTVEQLLRTTQMASAYTTGEKDTATNKSAAPNVRWAPALDDRRRPGEEESPGPGSDSGLPESRENTLASSEARKDEDDDDHVRVLPEFLAVVRIMQPPEKASYRRSLTWWRRLRYDAYALVTKKWFEWGMTLLIVLNVAVMGAERVGQPWWQDKFGDVVNDIVSGAFCIEMILLHLGVGPRLYWRNGRDAFDGVITIASLVDIAVTASGVQSTGGLSALRALRLLRLLKLAKQFKQLHRLITIIGLAVSGMGSMTLLLGLFLLIYSLLGMQLFGYKLGSCDFVPGATSSCPPGESFDSISCPAYQYCFLPCTASEQGQWIDISGSKFGDRALCERFPRDASAFPSVPPIYLANVGAQDIPDFTFDNLMSAITSVFVILAQDGWSDMMHLGMKRLGDAYVLYYVSCVFIGMYIILSMFLAILIDGFADNKAAMEAKEEEKSKKNPRKLTRTVSATQAVRYLTDRMAGFGNQVLERSKTIKLALGRALREREESSRRPLADGEEDELPNRPSGGARRISSGLAGLLDGRASRQVMPLMDDGFTDGNTDSLQSDGRGRSRDSRGLRRDSISQRSGGLPPIKAGRSTQLGGMSSTSFSPEYANSALARKAAMRASLGTTGPSRGSSLVPRVGRDSMTPVAEGGGDKVNTTGGFMSVVGAVGASAYMNGEAGRGEEDGKPSDASARSSMSQPRVVQSDTSTDLGTKSVDTGATDQPSDERKLEGKALFILGPQHPLRVAVAKVVLHPFFDLFILLVIVTSSLCLSLDAPTLHPDSGLKKALNALDIVFVILFALEFIGKVITLGFVGPKQAYLRSPWNWLDFAIVIIGFVLLGVGNNRNVRFLRVLRTFRALRPLRMIAWNPGMRVVVNAIFQAIPPLFDVVLVCGLVYFIFAVLGISLLKGRLGDCIDVSTGNPVDPHLIAPVLLGNHRAISRDWCVENGGLHNITLFAYHTDILGVGNVPTFDPPLLLQTEWINYAANFDSIEQALLTLYEIASLEFWETYMVQGIRAPSDPGWSSKRANNEAMAVFFLVFLVVGVFFILNLFIGVVIDKFNEIKESAEGVSVFLTEEQQAWVDIQRLLAMVSVKKSQGRPKGASRLRRRVFDWVTAPWFEYSMLVLIALNIIEMAMGHYDMSYAWTYALVVANTVFTLLFFIEACLKLYALKPKNYFRDHWNSFDFLVVVASLITVGLDLQSGKPSRDGGGAGLNLLRVLRVGRLVRLMRRAQGVRQLLQTLLFSLPALYNVGLVLFIFIFIFAVMGMQLFGTIIYGQTLDGHANFSTFPNSLFTLFRSLTGEDWPGLMHDGAGDLLPKTCFQMVQDCNPSTHPPCGADFFEGLFYTQSTIDKYSVPDQVVLNRCPAPRPIAILFWCIYSLFCGYIVLNLIIAVVLDNFKSATDESKLPVRRDHLQDFVDAWSIYDPVGSGYMDARYLPNLVRALDPPMGVRGLRGEAASSSTVIEIIMATEIPNHRGKVHFMETLRALSGRVAATELPEQAVRRVVKTLSRKLPGEHDVAFTMGHWHAALHFKAAVKSLLARKELADKLTATSSGPWDDRVNRLVARLQMRPLSVPGSRPSSGPSPSPSYGALLRPELSMGVAMGMGPGGGDGKASILDQARSRSRSPLRSGAAEKSQRDVSPMSGGEGEEGGTLKASRSGTAADWGRKPRLSKLLELKPTEK